MTLSLAKSVAAASLMAPAASAHADPQPTATEIFNLRTECGKLTRQIAKEKAGGRFQCLPH
jgi:hypothetical protein